MIVGIHDGHDAGVALIDGEKIYAINEERLVRIKHYRGFPEKSLVKVFEIGNVNPEDV